MAQQHMGAARGTAKNPPDGGWILIIVYPLVNKQFAIENRHRNS